MLETIYEGNWFFRVCKVNTVSDRDFEHGIAAFIKSRSEIKHLMTFEIKPFVKDIFFLFSVYGKYFVRDY